MKARILGLVCLAFSFATVAGAQTKTTGTLDCKKPDASAPMEIGDHPGHMMMTQKYTCTWTTGMMMEGLSSKDGASGEMVEMTASNMMVSGWHVSNMDNGDKIYVSYSGKAAMKDGKPGDMKGNWHYTGGTGKLKGVTGKGTYTVHMNDDGTATAQVEGDYMVPPPAPKKAPKGK
jgi:hypothetical protein